MKSRLAVAALMTAALIGTATSGAQASGLAIYDPSYDTHTTQGSPSSAQKASADLTKIDYWVGTSNFWVVWHLRDIRSDFHPTAVFLGGKSGYIDFDVYGPNDAHVRGLYTYSGSYACHTTPTYDYTANTITAHWPRTCVHKGVRFYPIGYSDYSNAANTIDVIDQTAQGTSIVINP